MSAMDNHQKVLFLLLVGLNLLFCGAIIPLPKYYKVSATAFGIVKYFDVSTNAPNCLILNDAIKRFHKTSLHAAITENSGSSYFVNTVVLSSVKITLGSQCFENSSIKLWPSTHMNENYNISISQQGIYLSSNEVWGALRGLETLAQLIYKDNNGLYLVNETVIIDSPRFAFRGFLLDTSRHFLTVPVIMEHLEAMAISKYNAFHWHIVDDQSFPYDSPTFPNLSKLGAFRWPSHVYTQEDIADILEFARRRGIRVVPEFDTPGHTESWGPGQPGLLTPCYSSGKPDGSFGPVDPSNETNYKFLASLIGEITRVFPDEYFHLGGDEVSFGCWKSNPQITAFMQKSGFGTDYSKLEEYYANRLIQLVGTAKPVTKTQNVIAWQDMFDNNVKLPPDTMVHVWRDKWEEEMAAVTDQGYKTILSSCWYLNYINYGIDWHPFYTCEPLAFNGTDAQKALVIGGATCMWGEYVDSANVISRSWPRSAVVAERLWSPKEVVDVGDMEGRLEILRCRMILRNINAEPPNGPGFCDAEPHSYHWSLNA